MDQPVSDLAAGRAEQFVRRAYRSSPLLWTAFLAVHLIPVILSLTVVRDSGFGDVRLYLQWMEQGLNGQGWPVLDQAWVYPFGALLPMLALAPLSGPESYLLGWFMLTLSLNIMVLVMLESSDRPRRLASWWWVLSILALGPVAISRLESVMVPVTVMAVLLIARRPVIAAALITLAGWIKVFPMVWLIPLALAFPRRSSRMVGASLLVSAAMILPALLLGSGGRIFSFLTMQTDRGLQIEAVPASILQAMRWWDDGVRPLYDGELNTWQFEGRLADQLGQLATLLTVPAVLIIYVLLLLALRTAPQQRVQILAAGIFATTLALIVFNQVGSPQYMAWLSAGIVLGLVSRRPGEGHWVRWAAVVLVINAGTQVVYPHLYRELVHGSPVLIGLLVARNVALIVLLIAVTTWLAQIRSTATTTPREPVTVTA